jgi:poly(A) polymerase
MGVERDRLVEAFRQQGHQLWVVGGALRDRLLGQGNVDEDFATSAIPDEVEALAASLGRPVMTVGRRLGTSIEEDLARRDFTVNALAENAVTGERLDPFGGEADLRARLIRAVGEPAARFSEDPLRILRGLRFASQLDFEVEATTLAGMAETAPLLATLSQERVTAELDRLLQGRRPGRGLRLLEATGALGVVLPEMAGMPGCEQNRFHRFDAWEHTVATVEAIDPGTPEQARTRRWTAFLHDVGKPFVRHRKANGEWGFYRHETIGAEIAGALLERLRLNRREALAIRLLVRRHMDRPNVADRRSVRRFMAKCEGHWEDLIALKRADNASHTYDDHEYHDALEALCRRIAEEDAEALRAESPLTGDDLVELFQREPGPWIRVVKQRLSAMVLDGELAPGDRAAAERIARRLMSRDATAPGR